MRNLLISVADLLNTIFAIVIIIIGFYLGFWLGGVRYGTNNAALFWGAGGAFVGLLFAALACGFMAAIFDIRDDVRAIRMGMGPGGGGSWQPLSATAQTRRVDPTL